MTVREGQPTLSVDPEASLRTELTGAIAAAQIDIANAIAELARSGTDSAALTNQGHALQQLQKQVGSANLGSLLALRSDVTIAASSATALANQATSTAASAAANTNLSPSQRARASIEAVQRDLFEKRVLDPYLQFASAEDEEAYRKREAGRKEAVDRERAKGTLEGDRNAAAILDQQLRDAGAHGADRSPDFADMMRQTKSATADLQSARQRPEASNAPPIVDRDKRAQPAASEDELGDILATLKAAGVTTPANQARDAGHGVNVAAVSSREGATPIRNG